jgi:hypothetical protein
VFPLKLIFLLGLDKLLHLKAEYNPKDDKNIDFRGILDIGPVDLVLNPLLVSRLMKFFRNPIQPVIASESKPNSKAYSRVQLELLLEHTKKIDLHINCGSPNLIIPLDCTKKETDLLVVDFGNFRMDSKGQGDQQLDKDAQFYSNYAVHTFHSYASIIN